MLNRRPGGPELSAAVEEGCCPKKDDRRLGKGILPFPPAEPCSARPPSPALAGGMCRAQQVGAVGGFRLCATAFWKGGLCAAWERPSHCPGGCWVSNPISGEISLLLLLQMWQMKSTMVFTGTAGWGFSTTYVLKYQRCFLW